MLRIGRGSEALPGGLLGHAEHERDSSPAASVGPRGNDGVSEFVLGVGELGKRDGDAP